MEKQRAIRNTEFTRAPTTLKSLEVITRAPPIPFKMCFARHRRADSCCRDNDGDRPISNKF